MVECVPLGQSGFRMRHRSTTVFIDPYLSDSVERLEGPRLRRRVPIWKSPQQIDDADWVLLTHDHIDHCDLDTVIPMSEASPSCRFIAPREVCDKLRGHGIASNRLVVAPTEWMDLGDGIRVHATPAAHPTVDLDSAGGWLYVGYVIEYDGRRIYHAGDTSLDAALIEFLARLQPIDTAMLPVNERNFFRDQLGILGNMSVRDAFGFAAVLGVRTLVPMHWDMFEPNSVFRDELVLYHNLSASPFELRINPDVL